MVGQGYCAYNQIFNLARVERFDNARQSCGSCIVLLVGDLLVGDGPELEENLETLRRREAPIVLPGRFFSLPEGSELGDKGLHNPHLTRSHAPRPRT